MPDDSLEELRKGLLVTAYKEGFWRGFSAGATVMMTLAVLAAAIVAYQ